MPDPHRIAIVTDSISDIPPEFAESMDIRIVPLSLRFGQETFRDRIDLSTDDLIERLDHDDSLPATSSPSRRSFEILFRELAQQRDAIIAILSSSRLSATVKAARLAAQSLQDDVQIEIIDSLNVSAALGLQVLHACDLRAAGVPADEIAERLRTEAPLNHLIFVVETLDHLRRNGRVGRASNILGALLQLKPILRIDEGQVIPFERARTHARALDVLIEFVESLPAVEEIVVVYDTTPDDVEALLPRLEEVAPDALIRSTQFGPALAAHIGPGVVGLAVRERPV